MKSSRLSSDIARPVSRTTLLLSMQSSIRDGRRNCLGDDGDAGDDISPNRGDWIRTAGDASIRAGEQHLVQVPPVVARVTWIRPSGCALPGFARAFTSWVKMAS